MLALLANPASDRRIDNEMDVEVAIRADGSLVCSRGNVDDSLSKKAWSDMVLLHPHLGEGVWSDIRVDKSKESIAADQTNRTLAFVTVGLGHPCPDIPALIDSGCVVNAISPAMVAAKGLVIEQGKPVFLRSIQGRMLELKEFVKVIVTMRAIVGVEQELRTIGVPMGF